MCCIPCHNHALRDCLENWWLRNYKGSASRNRNNSDTVREGQGRLDKVIINRHWDRDRDKNHRDRDYRNRDRDRHQSARGKGKVSSLKVCKATSPLCWVCIKYYLMKFVILLVPIWTAISPLYILNQPFMREGISKWVYVWNDLASKPEIQNSVSELLVCKTAQNEEQHLGQSIHAFRRWI